MIAEWKERNDDYLTRSRSSSTTAPEEEEEEEEDSEFLVPPWSRVCHMICERGGLRNLYVCEYVKEEL